MVQRPVKKTPGSMLTVSAATSPSTRAPDFISMAPSARMLPHDAAQDERLAHLDVRAHDPVLADLEPLAVEDVALELAIDAQRARHHERAAEARADADHGVRPVGLVLAERDET